MSPGRRCVALDLEALAENAVGAGEGPVHVAVDEHVVPEHVGPELGVEQGSVGPQRDLGIDYRVQRLVLDDDPLGGVLGRRPVDGGHRRHGLADEPDPIDGQAVVANGHRRGNQGRIGPSAGPPRPRPAPLAPRRGLGVPRVHAHDARVGVGAAQHRGVQQPGTDRSSR